MDASTVIEVLLGALGAVLWYMYRKMEVKSDNNEKALLEYKLYCAQTYVTNDQLSRAIESLNKTIATVADGVRRIETRLDNIVDNKE